MEEQKQESKDERDIVNTIYDKADSENPEKVPGVEPVVASSCNGLSDIAINERRARKERRQRNGKRKKRSGENDSMIKLPRLRPTHFIAFRVNNPSLIERVETNLK